MPVPVRSPNSSNIQSLPPVSELKPRRVSTALDRPAKGARSGFTLQWRFDPEKGYAVAAWVGRTD